MVWILCFAVRDEVGPSSQTRVRLESGAVLAAVYHVIRAESDREEVTNILGEIIVNDVIREYAEKHGVYTPLHEV